MSEIRASKGLSIRQCKAEATHHSRPPGKYGINIRHPSLGFRHYKTQKDLEYFVRQLQCQYSRGWHTRGSLRDSRETCLALRMIYLGFVITTRMICLGSFITLRMIHLEFFITLRIMYLGFPIKTRTMCLGSFITPPMIYLEIIIYNSASYMLRICYNTGMIYLGLAIRARMIYLEFVISNTASYMLRICYNSADDLLGIRHI